MLALSIGIQQFRNYKPGSKFVPFNHERHTYAAHMGFFQSFGLKHGNAPGEAPGNARYTPLTELDVASIRDKAKQERIYVGEAVDQQARELAMMLVRSQEEVELLDALSFSIRELLRNVVEHSGALRISYCAQYWPLKNTVEVAIADQGCGLKASLSSNKNLQIVTDRDAIQYSMLPGISGKTHNQPGTPTEWKNYGYGLYMTSRICRNGGRFFICSGDAAVALVSKSKYDFSCAIDGTLVGMKISIPMISGLARQMAKIREEGRAASKVLAGAKALDAAAVSTIITKDFALD